MMGKLAVRNVNYWAETFGKGEPLVLLHGFTGSGETWGFLKNSLKKIPASTYRHHRPWSNRFA